MEVKPKVDALEMLGIIPPCSGKQFASNLASRIGKLI